MSSTKFAPLRLLISVLAGALGVQSDANRQQDFQQSSALPFIVAGVLFVVCFVLGLLAFVSWLLP